MASEASSTVTGIPVYRSLNETFAIEIYPDGSAKLLIRSLMDGDSCIVESKVMEEVVRVWLAVRKKDGDG